MPNITFEAKIENLSLAIDFINKNIGETHPKLSMIELALEEIIINVINYAYEDSDSKEKPIQLGIRKITFDGQPYLAIWLKDWGKRFDPFGDATVPDLNLDIEDRPIGGLGVHLVKTISNHQFYSDDDGSNVVEIYFAAE